MKFKLKFGLLVLLCSAWSILGINSQYLDTSLVVDIRVNNLISQMTLAEKITQLGHSAPAISRLSVPSYNYWSEALHGVARSGLATSFPQAIALSSTWNPELIYQVATAISDEARVKNNVNGKGLVYWSPTINMARDPRWGRAEENYGEDTYLTTQIAVNFIRGLQGNHPKYLKTVATAKHFACNNVEHNRKGTSSNPDERSLREYYLPAFKATVNEGKVYSIMSAYNAVNGVPSPANRTLLMNILRNEWNFNGFVVSDCDAVENVWSPHAYVGSAMEATAVSLLNGNDLNCGSTFATYAQSALSSGLLKEADIDLALKRVFKARFLLGEFDPAASVPYKSIPASRLDCQEHRDLALRTAREAIVLLKNVNSTLPLNKDKIDTIAVIGPNANAVQLGGYSGTPLVSVSTLQGIADKLGINISSGVTEVENYTGQYGIRTEACTEGGSNVGYIQNGDYIYFDNIDFSTGKTKIDIRVASASAGGTLEILLDGQTGASLGTLAITSTGGWQNWVTLSFDIPVTSGKHTVYMKFTGASGYLYNINWFKIYNVGDPDPVGGSGRICYAKGCDIEGTINQTELNKAVTFAKKADVAIVVCGTDLSVADEGEDRSSLNLPGAQDQLIQAVYNANPNTIVILVNGSSLAINWAQNNVPAILTAWYDGQAQGTAIADVLFGDYNPGGKLTTTWYKSITDLPAMDDYDIKNNRTYMYFKGTPLYVFGHGLSYTTFTYSNLVVSSKNLNPGDSVSVSVEVTNSGPVAGEEVVQLYTHVQSALTRPVKELNGFKRISLLPAETKTVTFWLKHEALQYYDETTRTFKVENGNVDIYIGSSSEDIRLQDMISSTEATISETYKQNPFTVFQAEQLEGKSSTVSFKTVSQGNLCVNLTGNNSYMLVKNFNFNTIAKQFNANISSVNGNITLDVVLDNISGQVAGTLIITPTADLETYTVQSCSVNSISGIRDVYLVLRGESTSVCKIDWFNFQDNITGIGEVLTPEKHTGYRCSLFPNPVKTTFSIKYDLPVVSNVTMEIYSLQGTLLKSYNYANQAPGLHQKDLDVKAEKLNAGVYIIQYKTGSFNKSLLLKVL